MLVGILCVTRGIDRMTATRAERREVSKKVRYGRGRGTRVAVEIPWGIVGVVRGEGRV